MAAVRSGFSIASRFGISWSSRPASFSSSRLLSDSNFDNPTGFARSPKEGLGYGLDCRATPSNGNGVHAISSFRGSPVKCLPRLNGSASMILRQHMSTIGNTDESGSQVPYDAAPRIKFKRLDKTARHIMQILDKEAVAEVKEKQEIPEIKPGYIIQLKLEVPENRRRVSTIKGIVIARRNAGLNTTIRLRRMVAGVGIESLLPLYSPNIKEVKVLERKKVRRAKLYYLRDKMNEIRKLETLTSK